jgi:transposase
MSRGSQRCVDGGTAGKPVVNLTPLPVRGHKVIRSQKTHNLFPPDGEAFGPANRAWWEGLDLPASEKLRVRHDLSILDSLEPLIKGVEAELVRQSSIAPWAEQAAFLVQLPGIGVHKAMVLLAAIGDIRRFDGAHKLVGYAGLGARVHSSGEENYGVRITKQGR